MKLFLITLLYFAVVGLGIFFIFQIKNLSLKIKEHTKQINELQKELYKNLRVFQYRALDVSGNINKLLDKKSSMIAELILELSEHSQQI